MPDLAALKLRITWVLTCLIFYALPFLLVSYGLGKVWEGREVDGVRKAFDRLETILLGLRNRDTPQEFFTHIFDQLSSRAKKKNFGKSDFQNYLANHFRVLKSRFPGVFSFYVVDRNGEMIVPISEPNTPKRPLKKLFQVQREFLHGKNKSEVPFQEIIPVMKSFIGNLVTINLLKRSSYFDSVNMTEKNRYFYYFVCGDFGLYVHMNHVPNWDYLAIQDNCMRFSLAKKRDEIHVGFYRFGKPFPGQEDFEKALGEYKASNNANLDVGRHFFRFAGYSNTSFIWAAMNKSRMENFNLQRLAFWLFGTLVFSLLAIYGYRVMVIGVPLQFSIRWRLIVLFGFASGLPLAVIILAGWDYANQTYKNRVRETFDHGERVLKTVDAKFPQVLGAMETYFNRKFLPCNYESPEGISKFNAILETLNRRIPSAGLKLIDTRGNVVWYKGSDIFALKFLVSLVKRILATINQEEADEKMDSSAILIDTLGGAERLNEMINGLGTLTTFSFGKSEAWIFGYPLLRKSGKASHLIFMMWRKNDLEKIYIRQFLPRIQKNIGNVLLYSTTLTGSHHFPEKYAKNRALGRFVKNLQLRQGTTFGTIRMGRQNYLLTGIKPKELSTQYLVSMLPDREINDEVGLLKKRLWIFSILSAAMSIFIGFILSERFLTPIRQLSEGVEAIRRRNFDHRVPPGESDELGELALTFNRVMEGLTDLEVGRIVQESLLPSGSMKIGDYDIFGKTVTATELGGDYFELETLSDGKLLILIGDVTGHGVPAALVMAMAKAMVAERTFEGSSSPEGILSIMNQVMFKTLRRKRLMTCFLAMLDPQTNILSFANAGHNYPYLFPADGSEPVFLESNSAPLGAKKKLLFESKTMVFEPGAVVLFYTDGLVEQKMRNGEQVGYTNMIASIAPLVSLDPLESYEKIMVWFREILENKPQDDDVTIVLLCRKSPEKNSGEWKEDGVAK